MSGSPVHVFAATSTRSVVLGTGRSGVHRHGAIRRGDIPTILEGDEEPGTLVIIDGEFGQALAVSVTEIRSALRAGWSVWGSSSMGALRAAECRPIGMRGFGSIYRQYASGARSSDEDVAIAYDPDTLRPLTVPMVDIDHVLDDLRTHGTLSERTSAAVRDELRSISYRDRTVETTRTAIGRAGPAAASRFADLEQGSGWSLKDKDARLMLAVLSRVLGPADV